VSGTMKNINCDPKMASDPVKISVLVTTVAA